MGIYHYTFVQVHIMYNTKNEHYGFWVIMMWQCRSIVDEKRECTILVSDIDTRGVCACVGTGDTCQYSALSSHFLVNLKLL